MNPIVIIPSRMAATRLPGKPLADINGVPMIVRVMRAGQAADIGPVLVACGDQEIADAVRAAGGRAIMTDPALASGSDRVHAALQAFDPTGQYDVAVNLQGDLPTLPSAYLRSVLKPLADQRTDIATLVAPITTNDETESLSVVKVACAFSNDEDVAPALYFSRAAVPSGSGQRWHHIGVYAFRRPALDHFVSVPRSALEIRENLEQLRALEAGMRISCAKVETAPFGVDTPADLNRAREMV